MDICSNQDEKDDTKRDNISHTVQDVFQALNENQRWRKSDHVDTAQVCHTTGKIRLLSTRTNIVKNYGYTLGGKTYLCPEEALYFLEICKLEILLDQIPLSVERGRSLFLRADNTPSSHFDGSTCTVSEYTVYKYLAKQGYRPRRPNYVFTKLQEEFTPGESTSEVSPEDPESLEAEMFEEDSMHVGVEDPELAMENGQSPADIQSNPGTSPNSSGKRKLIPINNNGPADAATGKRPKFKVGVCEDDILPDKITGSLISGSSSSSTSPEIICDYECINDPSSVKVTYYSGEGLETIYELDPTSSFYCSTSYGDDPQPSTSRGLASYTVEEADSDIEFVDEVIFCHTGVEIEEVTNYDDEELPDIPYTSTLPQTTSFTTLRSPAKDHVFVDLVSSDDEDDVLEKDTVKEFSDHIWSQFVPQAKSKLGFPPAELIPKEIRRSGKDFVSSDTYQKTDDDCDSELKEIVDGLKLDSDPPDNLSSKLSHRNRAKSWNDWRQQEAKEIQDIFRGSLFGGAFTSEDSKKAAFDCDRAKFLNGWPNTNSNQNGDLETTHNKSSNSLENSYTYDLFLPSEKKFGRNLLGSQVKPSYRVMIKQETDVFLDFSKLAARKDAVPFLIAVVNEDQHVTFVSPGNSDIHDLFRQTNIVKN